MKQSLKGIFVVYGQQWETLFLNKYGGMNPSLGMSI
jgi:hypothetical protein